MTATSPEATDERLVAAAQSGSPDAFAVLFRRYRPEIARYASRTLGDDARAEDVVQEAFLSALRGIGTLDRPAGFKPWLYRIAHNACIDQMRRRARAEEVSFDANAIPAAEEIRLFRHVPSNHAQVAQKEEFRHLRQALTDLPASQAEILVLRELEGLSYDEIAVRMNISVSAVESMLFRARRSLRDEYGEISTGERCRRMRTVMAQTVEGVGRLRDRRALARHLHGCAECRRDAFVMGLGPMPEAERPTGVRAALSRVAALLPIPGFLNRRSEETGRLSSEGGRISSETGQLTSFGSTTGTTFASHAQATIAHVTATAGASVEHAATVIQKAAAVVAAAAVVGGGGFVAHGTRTQPPPAPPTAAKRVAGAPAPGIVAARPGALFTSPMPLSLAPLAGGPPAMVLAPATVLSATPDPQPAADPPAAPEPPPAEPPAVDSAAPVEPAVSEPPPPAPEPEPAAEPASEPPPVEAPPDPPPVAVDPPAPPPDPAPPADPVPPDTGGSLSPASDTDSGDTGGSGPLESLSA